LEKFNSVFQSKTSKTKQIKRNELIDQIDQKYNFEE
jgi:hypothetical protein